MSDATSRTYTLLNARPLWVLLGLLLFILLLQALVELLREPYELAPVRVDRPAELQRIFASNDYQWPPEETVPPLGVISLPPGMSDLDVEAKKSLFFRVLLPLTLAENTRLRTQRRFVENALARDVGPGGKEKQRLRTIARQYGIEGDPLEPANQMLLLRRLDVVPPALALAQAANESGWGSSRFAIEANNLFGIWTYRASAGLSPSRRGADARHYVRVYPSLQRAVRDYLHNLNIGHAYGALRRQRAAMRARGESLDALTLAGALERYSERGAEYVDEIRAMIRGNDLSDLGKLKLAD